MKNTVSNRPYQGAAIFSYGFRPFFFFGALWAALAVPLWVLSYAVGDLGLPIQTGGVWHAHEMIFGYSSAIIAGFLLTAVPNWTGRAAIKGPPLMVLLVLWLSGRILLLFEWEFSAVGAIIDSAFLIVFASVIWQEIIASKNPRNTKIAIILSFLALANIGFHVSQSLGGLTFDQMTRLGLGNVLLLIVIIGGRIVPNFTSNWLKKRGELRAITFNKFDIAVIAVSVASIIGWSAFPFAIFSGVLLILAGLFNVVRLIRWKFWATFSEPLILILHIAYAWVAVAFLLSGAAILTPEAVSALSGIHAIGTGAIGVMTLAIMTRATLGHTGRVLRSDAGTNVIFLMVNLAAITRVSTPFLSSDLQMTATIFSAIFWSLAFLIYCLVYGRYLWRPRLEA